MPASCTPVIPPCAQRASAEASCASNCSSVGGGITAKTRSIALSTRMPLGSPSGPRRMRPPSGSFVSRVIRARRRASPLTHSACPSMRDRATGVEGQRVSSSARVGNAFSGQSFWSQPWPMSQSAWKAERGAASRRSSASARESAPTRITEDRPRPRPERWPCASDRPGTTVASPRSTTRASAPAAKSTSSRVPVASTLPSFTASASASGRWGSSVRTRRATYTVVEEGEGVASGPR